MKQKHNHFILNRYTTGILILLIVVIASTLAITKHNRTDAAPEPKITPSASSASEFSFTGASGWTQGATNKTSMALFHKYDCFTSIEHKPGAVDVTAELQKTQASLTSGSYTSTPSGVLAATLQTSTGQQQYQLHQYGVTGTGSAGQVKGGQEYGYLPLSNGYLFIQANCDTATELPATIPALQAVKFSE